MSDTELNIQIRAKLDPGVRRAINGITSDVRKAERVRTQDAQRSEREIQRASEQSATRRRQLIGSMVKDFKRAEEEKRREQARTIREAEALERQRARGAQRIQSAIDRQGRPMASVNGGSRRGASGASSPAGGGDLSSLLGPVGGLAGVVAAVATAVNVYANRVQNSTRIIGVQDTEQTLAQFQELDRLLTNTLLDAQFNSGLSEREANDIRASVFDQVAKRGIDPEDIIEFLGSGQGRFDMLREFAGSLDQVGQASIATGASVSDLGAVLGGAGQQLSLDADQWGNALGILAQQAAVGTVEFRNLAQDFGPVLGAFAGARGTTGIDAVSEFGALAQVMGTLGVGASETATVMERLLAGLTDGDRVARLRELGVNIADESGRALPIDEIMQQLASSRALDNPRVFAEAIGDDINMRRGFRALRDTQMRDPQFVARMMAAEGSAGVEQFEARERFVESRSFQQARLVRGRNIRDISRQGQSLVQEHVDRARSTARFEGENPRTAEAIPDFLIPLVAGLMNPAETGSALPFRDMRSGALLGARRTPNTQSFAQASPALVGALTGEQASTRAAEATERLATEQARAREATAASTSATLDLAAAIRSLGQRPDTGTDTGVQ